MWRENGGSCTMRSFIICTHPQILLSRSSQDKWDGQGMWHAWERLEKCTRFWWEVRSKKSTRKTKAKMGGWILGRLAGGVWIGFDWLMIGTGGWLLWMRWWTFSLLLRGLSYLEVCCSLWGKDWVLKYDLDELRLQRIRAQSGTIRLYCIWEWNYSTSNYSYCWSCEWKK
jgi:hypothetical protein